jgi:hypothetical protein
VNDDDVIGIGIGFGSGGVDGGWETAMVDGLRLEMDAGGEDGDIGGLATRVSLISPEFCRVEDEREVGRAIGIPLEGYVGDDGGEAFDDDALNPSSHAIR